MLIYFVRHGHPNYKDDCLTELGKNQAALYGETMLNDAVCRLLRLEEKYE